MNTTNSPTTNQIPSPWLTKSEAAKYAKVSERTIDNWRLGGLAWSAPSSTILIHVADLDKYINRSGARGRASA